jgi:hypothetical protein
MPDATAQIGRLLIGAGIVLVVAGVLFILARPLHLGALPGDFTVSGRGWQATLLIGTSLVLSVIFTLVLNLLLRRPR